ncbi:MAG: META domain-containing protein [Leeuwenhoekiella sp.]
MKKYAFFALFSLFLASCASHTETIFVSSSPTPCESSNQNECLQYKKDSLAAWSSLPENIKGFDYKPGYIYKLEVEPTKRSEEESGKRYSLKKVLQRTKMEIVNKEPTGEYVVESFDGKSVSEKDIRMNFNAETGQINGKGVCNRFSGTYTVSGTKIKFSQAATTKMMCQEPALERDFFRSMNIVDRYTLENERLVLMQGEEIILTALFKK